MLFNSLQFAVFLPVVVVLAWGVRRSPRLRVLLLLAASYYFYMSWNWRYAGLLLFSTWVDYVVGLRLPRATSTAARRSLLWVSITANLGVLFFFKYFDFAWRGISEGLGALGVGVPVVSYGFLLPVGISFYTFQSLSYTIDVYRGELEPTRSFARFALFVSFFPQLVAGPIVRAKDFLPQLARTPVCDDVQAQHGVWLILVGLFKKICLADVLAATLVDAVFANPGGFGRLELLLAAYGYSFQIYCDFSGYSDIAIGAAALLGYRLPINFDRPFTALSLRDFWRRWHISLSTWLRDYLYIPLGGSRRGPVRTYGNLMATMLLGGLWHGANWTFVIWGAIHGGVLAIERFMSPGRPSTARRWGGDGLRWLVTFHVVVVAFVIFRCSSISDFAAFGGQFARAPMSSGAVPVLFVAALLVAVLIHFTPRGWQNDLWRAYRALPAGGQGALAACAVVLFAVLSTPQAPFIYFQF